MKSILKITLTLIGCLIFQTNYAQTLDTRMYIFGHSLLDHRPPLIPTPSDETTVPHWLTLLNQQEGNTYAATGQYGFLPQHANLPPIAQWGYDIVPEVWDSDVESFADADFNKVLITAGNFMQWQAPNLPYPGQGSMTPISATETIMDWLVLQENNIDIYIYENWPDMAGYLGGGFPPTPTEFDNYNNYTTNAFHNWWITYQDALLSSRPGINVRMIPVGPILAQLYRDTILTNVPVTELYEDDAPHGRATTYFLASLITHMAINEQIADINYTVPSIVHPLVSANYTAIINYIWNELAGFVDANGNSRVFNTNAPLPIELVAFEAKQNDDYIALTWHTESEMNNAKFEIKHSVDGQSFKTIGTIEGRGTTNEMSSYHFEHYNYSFGENYYQLKQIDHDQQFNYSPITSVYIDELVSAFSIFPNPSISGEVTILIPANREEAVRIQCFDQLGKLIMDQQGQLIEGINSFYLPNEQLKKGLYFIKVQKGNEILSKKLIIE